MNIKNLNRNCIFSSLSIFSVLQDLDSKKLSVTDWLIYIPYAILIFFNCRYSEFDNCNSQKILIKICSCKGETVCH